MNIFSSLAMAAGGTSYTFKEIKIATPGGTADAQNSPLTDKISVTTSGDLNYKCAAVTDTEHNKECGFYPIGDKFTCDGAYMFLAAGNSNDNSIFTLTMPKIKKGSRVTITFAKPTVTNNGSAYRNTNDPYAYFKIADRYLSINGDNFDTWRTESIVTGEDTDNIVFTCDKWGAVAVSKIEITENDGAKLYSLSANSMQYANMTVNGIKFFADENGEIPPISFNEGENVTVSAAKDGYTAAEKTILMNDNTSLNIPLECEVNSTYYESDFGNPNGTLAPDGEFKMSDGIDAKEITRLLSNITFKDNGKLDIMTDNGCALSLSYNDGIYANGTLITKKDNMEFDAVFDKAINSIVLTQNETPTVIEKMNDFNKITALNGSNVTLEYIGVTYPDMTNISIEGPDKVYCTQTSLKDIYKYSIKTDYKRPGTRFDLELINNDNAFIKSNDTNDIYITVTDHTDRDITLSVSYMGKSVIKSIDVENDPIIKHSTVSNTVLNLGEKTALASTNTDEDGNIINSEIKDLKSSDESVIKITEDGMLKAVGKGKAIITYNAYTGTDNIFTAEFTVDRYYISRSSFEDTVYILNDFGDNKNISSYKLNLFNNAVTEEIAPTDIPAISIPHDGTLITLQFNSDGTLYSTTSRAVKANDIAAAPSKSDKLYLCSDNNIYELNDINTTAKGFAISSGSAFEIDPVYTFNNIGDVKDEGKTLDSTFPKGLYDISFKKAETKRGDIFVNGYMAGNNVDQADADRRVEDGALYKAEDLSIDTGKITVSMTDGSTVLDYVTVEKKPDFYTANRPQRVYIIGDSLACEYYGSFKEEVGGGRAGWGQQIGSFLYAPVTNLANSGQFAAGLYKTAFPSVIHNGKKGDILLIECGYNDRNYSTRKEMTSCVKAMIEECRQNGIYPIIVTPNASRHDYKPSVVWSSYLRDIAADTECDLIDLSKESYDFLYSLYGNDEDNVVTMNYNLTAVGGDTLHSSYAGAYKWASIVAQGLKDIGLDVKTDFSYTFTDTLGNTITAQVK